jgi:hypothetical protein
LGGPLQIGEHALDGLRTRVAAVAQIEYKSWITNGIPAESGRSCVIPAKESFYLAEQIHLSFSLWSHCDSALHYLPTQFLLV